jgi:hypothetical protein
MITEEKCVFCKFFGGKNATLTKFNEQIKKNQEETVVSDIDFDHKRKPWTN